MRRPISIASFNNLRNIKRYCPEITTIIDVGANKGQFTFAAIHLFPNATVFSFEPLRRNYQKMQHLFNGNSKVKLFNFGLGSENGELEFYEHSYDQISSFLKVNPSNSNPNYKDSLSTSTKVSVRRLDDIIEFECIVSPVLLKLDVQGFEEQVLLGSLNLLKSIDYIMIELPFEELYDKQKLFNDMNEILLNLGFYLMAPLGFNTGKDNNIIEIDALYKNKERN
jgi:FkbM family methyltransferase